MTLPEMASLRELLAAATPGPWEIRPIGYINFRVPGADDYMIVAADAACIGVAWYPGSKEAATDAALIVAAVNALPTLLDRLEAAERDAARYRWLRDKFPLDKTVREWEEEESRTNNRIVNVVRREIFWDYDFYDAVADLCGHCESEGDIPTLDAAIDAALPPCADTATGVEK